MGDGGVDLRIYSHDAVGELLTLVQAKKYRRRAITLEAVQALASAVEEERASRGLFVTTSRYLPSARKFAERRRNRLTLADADRVGEWSQTASRNIIEARVHGALQEAREALVTDGPAWLEERIYRAWAGYNTSYSIFALLLRSSASAGLLVRIPAEEQPIPPGADHNLYIPRQRGFEVPKLDLKPEDLVEGKVFRARRRADDSFWGRKQLFTRWNGELSWFDRLD